MAAAALADQVAAFCAAQRLLRRGEKVVVGVSGGADSVSLLHLLVELRPLLKLTLTVAHLNHQLRGDDAAADAEFVQTLAQRLQLPVVTESINVAELAAGRKQSVEEAARQVRYAFLWRVAHHTGSSAIAVGHHADDQTETVLMHFLRGSGLDGLRGMLPRLELAELRLHPADIPTAAPSPWLIRPLLHLSRAQLETYCREHHLDFRQDESNLDTTYFRNRLRHELIPQLETYNPNIRQILQRTAQVIAADTDLLQTRLAELWPTVVVRQLPDTIEFDLDVWQGLHLALKRSALRRAVYHLRRSLRDVGFEHLDRALAVVEKGQTGGQATLPQGVLLTVGYRTFTLAVDPAPPRLDIPQLFGPAEIPVTVPGVTPLPNTPWRLVTALLPRAAVNLNTVKQAEGWEAYLDANAVGEQAVLRPRLPGDTFCPLGMGDRRKKVNEFMIDRKIPAEWRPHIPLLVAGGQVLWVCGYRPDDRAAIRPTTHRVIHLKFERG
jgi:tRNA(Ile)-lysidine synthase